MSLRKHHKSLASFIHPIPNACPWLRNSYDPGHNVLNKFLAVVDFTLDIATWWRGNRQSKISLAHISSLSEAILVCILQTKGNKGGPAYSCCSAQVIKIDQLWWGGLIFLKLGSFWTSMHVLILHWMHSIHNPLQVHFKETKCAGLWWRLSKGKRNWEVVSVDVRLEISGHIALSIQLVSLSNVFYLSRFP